MTALRSLLFNVLFYGGTALACFILLWGLIMPRKMMIAAIRVYLVYVAWIERVVAGLSYQVEGLEHLPKGPMIIAAKHQSAWETMKLHLLMDDPAIVLKKELLNIPIWGWYARRAKLIPIDRSAGRKAVEVMLQAAREALADNRPIVIFPQGTRVAPGVWKDYKNGVAILYEALNIPIVPLAMNSGVFWGRQSYTKHAGRITLRYLPAIPAGLSREDAMQKLVSELEGVSDQLVQQVGGPATPIPEKYLTKAS